MPDARIICYGLPSDPAEHLIGILKPGDRGVVIRFAVTDLKAVEEAVAQ